MQATDPDYLSGPFRIVSGRQELLRDGTAVPLGGRAFDVLRTLVARAGELVTKQELFDAVWPETTVEENNLTVAISAVRRALGCGVDGARYIATVTGRGYRFVAPVQADRLAVPPKQASADALPPTNLPAALAPLIGRDDDVAQVQALLSRARLVTSTGTGGVGKTRLALAIGQAELARHPDVVWPDGIWMVELGALGDPDLVMDGIAGALGLPLQPNRPAIQQVAAWLKQRRLLLVLDNCEHLVESVSRTAATLLSGCAGITILATSREPLRVAGEQAYLLPSLSVPKASEGLTAEAALRHPAVQLFVERAAALSSYRLTETDAPLVAEICRRLDGIALAIELAAPRLRMLGAAGLLRRLDDRFHFLTGGSRTALSHHQTLRALIDWSYHLLGDDERMLMRRLSVFAGGWTLEAAVAVAGDGALDEWLVLDLLTSLVDKSLVQAENAAGGTRYRFLESTRHYAAEKLEEAGDTAPARRHTEYLVRLLTSVEPEYETVPTRLWLEPLAAEIDNVRAALAWAFGPDGDADLGTALVAYCRPLWLELSLHAERRRWLDRAARHLHPGTPDGVAARIHVARAHRTTFGFRSAAEEAERAVAFARRAGEPMILAMALLCLTATKLSPAGGDAARPLLDEALALVLPLGDTNLLAGLRSTQAVAAVLSGDGAAARRFCEEGIAVARSTGGHRPLLILLSNLAEFCFAAGDVPGAIAAAHEAIVTARATNTRVTECNTSGNLGAYLLIEDRTDEAVGVLTSALRLARSLSEDFLAGNAIQHLALVAARRGRLREAAKLISHVDAALARDGNEREATERATAERVWALLEAGLPEAERTALAIAGAAMTREEAGALALELGESGGS